MGRLCGFRFRCQHTTKCCNGENQCIVIKVMFHASKILSVSASRHTTSSAYHICKILSSKNMLFFAHIAANTFPIPHFAARRTDTNTSGITGISCWQKFVPFEHLESAHQKTAASYWWRQCHQFAATSGTLLRLSSPHRIK